MKLLLSPRFSEDSIALQNAAWDQGWEVQRLQGWRTEPIEDVGAIYGEPLWARAVAAQVGRVLIEPPLDWLTTLPRELVNRSIRYGTVESLWPIEFPAFIKPADDKRFAAAVYESLPELDAHWPILVSQVMPIWREYRMWILNGKAIASCFYRGETRGGFNTYELSEFAGACARLPNNPPAMVIDVAQGYNGKFSVIEANPCFGSGIYKSDPEKVLDVLQAACVIEAPAEFTQPVSLE